MTLSADKESLRRWVRVEARKVPVAERARASQQLIQRLLGLPLWQEARTVLLYLPFPSEPDIRPLFVSAWEVGKTTALLRFNPAPTRLTRRGMRGWLTLRIDRLVVDGVSLRESPNGALALSFPERRDSANRRHAVVRPQDDGTRRAIEEQVFSALGVKGDWA